MSQLQTPPNMNREEMLQKLHEFGFAITWPDADWKDIGFTEHEIWINNKGYGYFACDEPNLRYKLAPIPCNKWQEIRQKLQNHTLIYADILGTSLIDILYFENEADFSNDMLSGLLSLPDILDKSFYCIDTDDGLLFIYTEREFHDLLTRDWCDIEWESLDDHTLSCWIDRLFDKNTELDYYWDV